MEQQKIIIMKRGGRCPVDEFELRRIIYDYIKEICHFSQMQVFSTSSYQRNYFQLQIDEAINGLINLLLEREELALQQNNLAHQIEIMQQEQFGSQTDLENPAGFQANQENQTELQAAQENMTGETGPPRVITLEELADADGSNGKKAYVAVNGNVYDVSLASRWGGGTHFGLYAGRDLTGEFVACHNAMFEILRILPIIGVLQ